MADGKVKIQIETNAEKASYDMKKLDKSLQDVKNSGQATVSSAENVKTAMNGLSMALKGLGIAFLGKEIFDIGKNAVSTAAKFEQLAVSLRIMTGSAQAGQELTNSLVELANKTPMTTETLTQATQTLLAFGESASNVIEDLRILGDISGGEAQRFQSLALAFAQVGSTGKLTGQDLLQMVNQGFNPLQIMAEKTGLTMSELKKRMSDGKITFQDVKNAMIDATSEGGRFYGLMNEQSQTLNGKLSTLSDTWDNLNKKIGDVFLPDLKDSIDGIMNFANKAESPLIRDLQILHDDFVAVSNAIASVTNFMGSLIPGTNNLANAFAGLNDKLQKTGLLFQYALTPLKLLKGDTTIKDLTKDFDKLNAQWRGINTNYWNRLTDGKYSPLLQNSDASKNNKVNNNRTGFSAGVNSIAEGSKSKSRKSTSSVKQMQDAVDILYQKAEKAKRNIQLLALQFGSSSPQVQKAYTDYKNINLAIEDMNSVFKEQVSTGAFEKLQQDISATAEKLKDLAVQGLTNTEEFENYKVKYLDYIKVAETANKSLTDKMGVDWEQMGRSAKNSLISGIVGSLRQGENAWQSFGNVALNVLENIAVELLKNIELEQVLTGVKAASKAVGGFFGGLFAKHGMAIENGVQKFASGGVVNQPTMFPMRSGMGLMGEAGAEAIMPLKRSANGDLGVQATRPNVNIYNQSGSQIETVERPNGDVDLFIKKVNNALANERTQAGFSQALQRNNSRGVQAS